MTNPEVIDDALLGLKGAEVPKPEPSEAPRSYVNQVRRSLHSSMLRWIKLPPPPPLPPPLLCSWLFLLLLPWLTCHPLHCVSLSSETR